MRRASHFHRWPGRHTGLWRLVLLGFCFCGGILLGQLAARSVPEASRTELAAYLRQYAAVWGETTDRTASLLRVAGVYLRYPLLVTVLGFCGAAGAALILPVLAEEMKLSKDWNYRELYLALLEATAKLCRVSKYRIYTLEQLQEAVYGKLYRLHGMDIPAFVQVISRDVLI